MLGVRVWDPRYASTTGLPTFLRVSITDITVGDFCSCCGSPQFVVMVIIAAVVSMICIILLASEGDIGS